MSDLGWRTTKILEDQLQDFLVEYSSKIRKLRWLYNDLLQMGLAILDMARSLDDGEHSDCDYLDILAKLNSMNPEWITETWQPGKELDVLDDDLEENDKENQ
jgi:hypothetical protein